jgi:putative transposase
VVDTTNPDQDARKDNPVVPSSWQFGGPILVANDSKVGLSYIPPGTPWNNGYIESFNNRLRKECLNRNHWTNLLEARVVIGDFKHEHNQRHRHSALGYLTPAEYAARCRHTHYPVACEIN